MMNFSAPTAGLSDRRGDDDGADSALLSLNAELTRAFALYAENALPKGALPELGPMRETSPEWRASLAEAEAEIVVDALTEQIRAIPAATRAGLAVKIRALSWDLGLTHPAGAPGAPPPFESRAMSALLEEAEAIIESTLAERGSPSSDLPPETM